MASTNLRRAIAVGTMAAAGLGVASGSAFAVNDPPKVEAPKVDPPKVDPPKVDPPKVDPPKVDPPKVDPPKGKRPHGFDPIFSVWGHQHRGFPPPHWQDPRWYDNGRHCPPRWEWEQRHHDWCPEAPHRECPPPPPPCHHHHHRHCPPPPPKHHGHHHHGHHHHQHHNHHHR